MNWRTFAVVLCLACAGTAMAQSPTRSTCWPWTSCAKTCPSIGGCPDDYCRKPCPVLCPVLRCGAADDYCRKPSPCLTNIASGGACDDYCRKALPSLLCPPCSPYLQCGTLLTHEIPSPRP